VISHGVKIRPLWGLALAVAFFLCADDRFIIREIWIDCRGFPWKEKPSVPSRQGGNLNSVPIEMKKCVAGPV